MNRRNRVFMEGYGSYGFPMSQNFDLVKVAAMERGWVFAQAQVRGGGDRGIAWHNDGKLFNKPNSFHDFISCAEYLISNRITHPNLLAARGSSAGGMLVAQSCLNMRPELFRACILDVPFLDVLSCLLDPDSPLAKTDYLEFGDPLTDSKIYELISSYSPYENLVRAEYPSVFLNMQLNDPRVPEWSILKFVEKFRDLAQEPTRVPHFGNNNMVVRINEEGGHFGSVSGDVNIYNGMQEFAWLDFLMLNPQSDLGEAQRDWENEMRKLKRL